MISKFKNQRLLGRDDHLLSDDTQSDDGNFDEGDEEEESPDYSFGKEDDSEEVI